MNNMLVSPLKDRYTLIHSESGSRGTESPAKDEGLLAKVLRIITSPFVLAWQILRSRPAVVHLNSALDHKAFWRDVMYLLVSKFFRRKVVLQLHGGSLSELCARRWMQRVLRIVFSIPDAIVLLATVEKHDFAALGIADRLIIIPNGVDVSQYRGPTERVHSGSIRRLIYLGRLVRTKGIFEAMQAVEILRLEPRFREIELRIAGSGPAREEIERFITDRQLVGNVALVGPLYGHDKVKFLQEADVFVFPTYHPEGLPYTILESLASGTPVITSRVAGIPDIVLDRVHGIMVNTKDPADVVKAIHELAESPDALRVMSKCCIERAMQEYGLERLAERFGNLYEAVRA
jgi:glycosyltransferase involved in cell wall biosynthesis